MSFWFRTTVSVTILIQSLLVPQGVIAQVLDSAAPITDRNIETEIRGRLQQRLASAYPDSFKVGIDVFWEPSDGWVSPEVFEWWKLRVHEGDADLTPEASAEAFERFKAEASVLPDNDEKRICAVVGASRNLVESRYGEIIDAHDLVFRVNRAQTGGFESDVGERTTHHVMWPRDLEEWQYDRGAVLLMNPVAKDVSKVFDRVVTLVGKFGWDFERVRLLHPEFVKYLHENWTGSRSQYPSTGFIALMVALHVCDEVAVFGFGADAKGRWDRYYDDDPVEVDGFHPTDFEGQLRDELETKRILKVYRGDRP